MKLRFLSSWAIIYALHGLWLSSLPIYLRFFLFPIFHQTSVRLIHPSCVNPTSSNTYQIPFVSVSEYPERMQRYLVFLAMTLIAPSILFCPFLFILFSFLFPLLITTEVIGRVLRPSFSSEKNFSFFQYLIWSRSRMYSERRTRCILFPIGGHGRQSSGLACFTHCPGYPSLPLYFLTKSHQYRPSD